LKKVIGSEQVSPEMQKLYRKVVGQLLWLSNLRCDIMYAVKELSEGLTGPTGDRFSKLKHLAKYLSGTKTFAQLPHPTVKLPPQHKSIRGLRLGWGPGSRKSTSGMSLFALGANITAHSRTQQLVALSRKSIAGRFGTSRKTKHFELRYLYVQELAQTGLIRLCKVLGTLNPAEILLAQILCIDILVLSDLSPSSRCCTSL
jgi:hypothetical protein